jgi:uncharacterized repeat protein (TIGR03847 family)
MARRFFLFDTVDRFVCGTVGPPGQRTFFLQAIKDGRVVSVQLEKAQVAVLAQRIGQILTELDRHGVAEVDDPESDDDRPLDEPLRDEFGVRTLSIGWDTDESRMVLEARSGSDQDDDDDDESDDEVDDDATEGPDVMRVRLSSAQAAGFVRRAGRVIGAGRPPCPFCGQPLNPEGHICPRKNGYLN